LVVFPYLFTDCHVQRRQVEKLLVAQPGIYPAVNQFYLVLNQRFVLLMEIVP